MGLNEIFRDHTRYELMSQTSDSKECQMCTLLLSWMSQSVGAGILGESWWYFQFCWSPKAKDYQEHTYTQTKPAVLGGETSQRRHSRSLSECAGNGLIGWDYAIISCSEYCSGSVGNIIIWFSARIVVVMFSDCWKGEFFQILTLLQSFEVCYGTILQVMAMLCAAHIFINISSICSIW